MRHFAKMLYNVLKLYIRLTFVRLAHTYVKLQAVAIKSFSAEYFYQCRRSPLLTIYSFSDMIDLRLSLAARPWWRQSKKAERSEASTRLPRRSWACFLGVFYCFLLFFCVFLVFLTVYLVFLATRFCITITIDRWYIIPTWYITLVPSFSV